MKWCVLSGVNNEFKYVYRWTGTGWKIQFNCKQKKLTAHLISCLKVGSMTRPYSLTFKFPVLGSPDGDDDCDEQVNIITGWSYPNNRIITHVFRRKWYSIIFLNHIYTYIVINIAMRLNLQWIYNMTGVLVRWDK